MAPITYEPQNYSTFVGIDVDKNSYAITIKDSIGLSVSKKMPANPEHLHNHIKKQYGDRDVIFAYEAGPTGFGLFDYLKAQGQTCMVVSPLSIPKASNERVKNNRIDSEKIADHLKSGQLRSVRVRQGGFRELRHLIHVREYQVQLRKAAKQRIKSLLLLTGMHDQLKDTEQNWSANYIRCLKEMCCSGSVRIRLDIYLTDLENSRKQTERVLKELRQFVQQNDEIHKSIRCLESIPGIGFITAVTLLGRIGSPQNLRNVREISAFVGLVPREKSTGDNVNRGSITHLGNAALRALLIECSWTAIRKDKELAQFFHRIKNRHHPKIGSRKAIVAVARKLTQRVYRVLKEQRKYQVR